MTTINYVSAPCGSGKTHSIINKIAARNSSGNVLLVQPTIPLIDSTVKTLLSVNPDLVIDKFHSGANEGGSVAAQFTDYLKRPYFRDQVALTTHTTFFNTPYFNKKSQWDVVVDEVPDVFDVFEEQLPEHFGIITDSLRVEPHGSIYGILHASDESRIRSIAENRNKDKATAIFVQLARWVISPHYECYVKLNQYDKLIRRRGESRHLTVYCVLKPSIFEGFNSVTIAGACFKETLLYRAWSDVRVKFIEDDEMSRQLRYREHENGSSVSLHYGTERNWSKYLRDSADNTVRDDMIQAADDLFGGEPFVWNENNDYREESRLNNLDGQIPLLGKSHGLNDYHHIDNAIFIPSLNYTPDRARFVSEVLKVGPDEQRRYLSGHAAYQALSRTSVRDPDNKHHKNWIVPDRFTADYVAGLYPGATVQSLGLVQPSARSRPGRSRIHENDNVRKAKNKDKRKKVIIGLEDESYFVSESDLETASHQEISGDVLSLKSNSNFVANFKGSIFRSRFDRECGSLVVRTDGKFIKFLRDRSKLEYLSKEDNELISPSYFNPQKHDSTNRGINNIEFIKGVWLDVDGGDMKPDHFAGLFPHLRIICYNSFNSKGDELRYRIYIPTDMAMDNEAYRLIIGEIIFVVEQAGYFKKGTHSAKPTHRVYHGIDNKLNGSDLFYLPCQPQDPSGAFFRDYKGGNRKPLKVKQWIQNGVFDTDICHNQPPLPSPNGPDTLTLDQQMKADEAIHRWDEVGTGPGQGNDGIFQLGLSLRAAGVGLWQLRDIMMQCAQSAHSPSDRIRDVERFITRVRQGLL